MSACAVGVLLASTETANAATVCDVPGSEGRPAVDYVYSSKSSSIGDEVCNPETGLPTTIVMMITDPIGTPTQGTPAWVETADGFRYMVKDAGDLLYRGGSVADPLVVASTNYPSAIQNIARIENPSNGTDAVINIGQNAEEWTAFITVEVPPPTPDTPDQVSDTEAGFVSIRPGQNGGNGAAGALFVGAKAGDDGQAGPATDVTISTMINADNNPGVTVASIGGDGGNGGNGYVGQGGARGGNGGSGGSVTATYDGQGIVTLGTGNHGVFVLSQSGTGGDAGDGFVSLGNSSGNGGSGSDGGDVSFIGEGRIVTLDADSHGVYALSVGNDGGSGGSSFGVVGNSGDGGAGGDGGNVALSNSSTIVTHGDGSHGMFGQSIGGGGGDAGRSGGFVALSAVGDLGGDAGDILIKNEGLIETIGDGSRGIFAQSIGGGGGAGGNSSGLIALGGTGAGGGDAGSVTVVNDVTGQIRTAGAGADGILAQSIAGSGGSGGSSAGIFALGGNGSIAGDGSDVLIQNSGSVATSGKNARGIVAQSIGGSGGDGGSSFGVVAIGGDGAGGGAGGQVTVVNSGLITTVGADSVAILAQSIGGGGGNGGSSGAVGGGFSASIGGSGGAGGAGGNVSINLGANGSLSRITTLGERATGIFAQSVGGGGGGGGGAVSASVSAGFSLNIAVGGTGGAGGNGGTVNAVTDNTQVTEVVTQGRDATGVLFQSIGGGGGNGAYAIAAGVGANPVANVGLGFSLGGGGGAAGDGGGVRVGASSPLRLNVLTFGDGAAGAVFQSIGGGGGNGGVSVATTAGGGGLVSANVSLAVGGSAGAGGDGGNILVNTAYSAETVGTNSAGIIVQSVGGGGGNAGGSVAANLSASGSGSLSASFAIGGQGGSAGVGGDISFASTGEFIGTSGADSSGVVVQSIGGGGGNGGYAIAPSLAGGTGVSFALSSAIGGDAGDGGRGGMVVATVRNDIETSGDNSVGILAQSIGGGGGNGGHGVAASGSVGALAGSANFVMGGTGGSGGHGGSIALATIDSEITTAGDNATGIIVQSVGGGGGNGGFAVGAGAAVGGMSISGSIALGGAGSEGGIGGDVSIALDTDVSTNGDNAVGILAQSIGGGGGNGGFSVAADISASAGGAAGLSGAIGGTGGSGTVAGAISGKLDASVTTIGANSSAIVIQSVGGGGGNAGFAVSAGVSGGAVGGGSAGLALGGAGGSGGSGGDVSLDRIQGTQLKTNGTDSTAILVQSVGGGGGQGGFAVSAAASGGGTAAGAVTAALGGGGGTGNNGGEISILDVSYELVETFGMGSSGVAVQSIGGGGGHGGIVVSGAVSGGGAASGAASLGLGGSGGTGGQGGDVSLGLTQTVIATAGENAHGLILQSIGGGGGSGGISIAGSGSGGGAVSGAASVSMGGNGGIGGSGGSVTLKASRVTLLTQGNASSGIIVQSVGGGGGNGGLSIAAGLSGAGTVAGSVAVSLGGDGGAGNAGGRVVANLFEAYISTTGHSSIGVLAQSIGGGGGNGGLTVGSGLSGAGTASGALSVSLGGSGGNGSSAGDVTLNAENTTVLTEGDNAHGLLAQSIGGGGGNGGLTVGAGGSGAGTAAGSISFAVGGSGGEGGTGGAVTANASGSFVTTQGDNAHGILVQSVGGGGGNGGLSIAAGATGAGTGAAGLSAAIGGTGGVGGHAGDVALNSIYEQVWTSGDNAAAIIAQSVGGGGGNGGVAVAATLSGASSGAGALSLGLGGRGGAAGDGGNVEINLDGQVDVFTDGRDSIGVLAQSVGGGGGNGGTAVAVSLGGAATGAIAGGIGIGGAGESGGDAGAVSLAGDLGIVATVGANSTGILAQSVGGGGGNGGMTVTVAGGGAGKGALSFGIGIGGSGGSGGDAQAVTSDLQLQQVQTQGDNATGLIAQSLGGGGGNGGMSVTAAINASRTGAAVAVGLGGSGGSGGRADVVTQNVRGSFDNDKALVLTRGDNSNGVLAQSIGGGGGNGGIAINGGISLSQQNGGVAAVGVGGFGGGGGNGADVANDVVADIQTFGDSSYGIVTQSLGGGGGNGGVAATGALSLSGQNGGAVGVGVGGFGGNAGNGAEASVDFVGNLYTAGANSAGLLTQSIGGSGGYGGISITGAASLTKSNGGAAAIGIGGFGGAGGDAGRVSSVTRGNVTTVGDAAIGIIAQAIGGGGGTGGTSITGSLSLSAQNSGLVGVGVGGFGGEGGAAAGVVVSAAGEISTSGADAHGILAQSIGGGGGNGGTNLVGSVGVSLSGDRGSKAANAAIGVGGFGAAGSSGQHVSVVFDGFLLAQPRNQDGSADQNRSSSGIIAQSIGGGGGNGATNISGGLSIASQSQSNVMEQSKAIGIVVGVGGFGGSGGNAGNVDVATTPGTNILASGADASGILASSIGGGGGNGGVNVSGGVVSDEMLIVGVGGLGSTGGTSGDVTVFVEGDVQVVAQVPERQDARPGTDEARAIAVEFLGEVAATVVDALVEDDRFFDQLLAAGAVSDDKNNADLSAGILAQSIGGGGGNGGLNVSGGLLVSKEGRLPSITVGIGGIGGEGATSGTVGLTQSGTIQVTGHNKQGVLAQSIGGGGGNGATNISGNLDWNSSESNEGRTDLAIVAGIGGFAGEGADAGDISVVSTGGISTHGDGARGIFAQSIGGGGGTGGMNVTGVAAQDSSALALSIGGFGSGGGSAGVVTVIRELGETNHTIITSGHASHGIQASSIGGGGGDGGANLILGYLSDRDSGGIGADIVDTTDIGLENDLLGREVSDGFNSLFELFNEDTSGFGDLETNNDLKDRQTQFAGQIVIGGAGGTAGNGNLVTVDHAGDILTMGNNSHGVLAQSVGGGGGNAGVNISKIRQTGDAGEDALGFSFALGGGAGLGGDGGEVIVTHSGNIETHGFNSYGVLAQSVGGGGGNASMDEVAIDGEGGLLSVVLGRQGGSGGAGHDVVLDFDGSVVTHGDFSIGILAQSIGNGGGNSSTTKVNLSIPVGDNEDSTDANDPDRDNPAASNVDAEPEGETLNVSFSVGLEGGQGGESGDVTIDANGSIITHGSSAHGVLAQSIGGGGGNSSSTEQLVSDSFAVGINVGGDGGQGGVAGAVSAVNHADILTNGVNSHGVSAQSIGGSGGNATAIGGIGASRGDTTEMASKSAAISLGGSGGVGMASDVVAIENTGNIYSRGDLSHGIFAQSAGGGGGNASAIVQQTFAGEALNGTAAMLSIGGNGGDGGSSSAVRVANSGQIITDGIRSIGITAQSIAGGGGNANSIVSGVVAENATNASIDLSVGGYGGIGNAAGDVTVSNLETGVIVTFGDLSHGIVGQSIGGGGGRSTATETYAGGSELGSESDPISNMALQISLGGNGGDGGTGGDVAVTNAGVIDTSGAVAHGIIAQSIGGGGGEAVSAISTAKAPSNADYNRSQVVGLGGGGGVGNMGGDVDVRNTGDIIVRGDGSYGIFAQSVGGGGGLGHASVNAGESLTSTAAELLQSGLSHLNLGSSGGAGGDAGDVEVANAGTITVVGDSAVGIFAQSVGGGGGAGGITSSGIFGDFVAQSFSSLLGGTDGTSGKAGDVTVTSTGNIYLLGKNSVAIMRNGVGGGGGFTSTQIDPVVPSQQNDNAPVDGAIRLGAENADNNDGAVFEVSHNGDVETLSENAFGLVTQSIGGGGGTSFSSFGTEETLNTSFAVGLGAMNSNNSRGNTITSVRKGTVLTLGLQSTGELLQSIGGGGGIASILTGPDSSAVGAKLKLGALAGLGNHGGDIQAAITGNTVTLDNTAPGLLIQSIGGGGGLVSASTIEANSIQLGGSDGAEGDAGNISLAYTGDIVTTGETSHGVVIQSIGGGGGLVLSGAGHHSPDVTFSTNNKGNGGDLSFVYEGDISVMGAHSSGLVLQSLGGGGGIVNDQFVGTAGGGGLGGSISLDYSGDIFADTEDGSAVILASEGSEGSGSITASFSGTLKGGMGDTDTRAALVVSGGTDNEITLGEDAFVYASNQQALLATDGNDQIGIFGSVIGNIDLGKGQNHIEVAEGAYLRTLNQLDLGDDGTLGLSGRWDIGGQVTLDSDTGSYLLPSFVEATTDVVGSLTMKDKSELLLDVRFLTSGQSGNGQSDLLKVSGSTTINGEVIPILHLLEKAAPLTIIDTGGTATGGGAFVQDTVFLDYSVTATETTSTGATVDLVIDPTFVLDGMTRNQAAVGGHINDILVGDGSSQLGGLFALLGNTTDEDAGVGAVDLLHGEGYAANGVIAYATGKNFRSIGEHQRRSSNHEHCAESICVWTSAEGLRADLPQTEQTRQIVGQSVAQAFGSHITLQNGAAIGLAYAATQGSLASGTNFQSSFEGDDFGLYGFTTWGEFDVSAILHFGQATHESRRDVGLSGYLPEGDLVSVEAGELDHVIQQYGLALTIDRTIELSENSFYLRPSGGLDLVHMLSTGGSETGTGPAGLTINESGGTFLTSTLGLEFGTRLTSLPDVTVDAYASADYQMRSADGIVVDTSFNGAPVGAAGFENFADFGDSATTLSAGLSVRDSDGSGFLDLSMRSEFGNGRRADSFRAELRITF